MWAIGPALSGLGEGLASRDILVPSRSSDFCGGSGACTLTRSPVGWCFPRNIGTAGFRVKSAVSRSSAAWQGHDSEDIWLSTFASPKFVQELQRWHDYNYQLGRKMGKKINKNVQTLYSVLCWRMCIASLLFFYFCSFIFYLSLFSKY